MTSGNSEEQGDGASVSATPEHSSPRVHEPSSTHQQCQSAYDSGFIKGYDRGRLDAESAHMTRDGLITLLTDLQHARCAYGTRHGDGRTCDCKFYPTWWEDIAAQSSEFTGCAELRLVIRMLEREKRTEESND